MQSVSKSGPEWTYATHCVADVSDGRPAIIGHTNLLEAKTGVHLLKQSKTSK